MNRVVEEVSAAYLVETVEGDVPAGYKKTEVGVIPEDWSFGALGQIGKFKNGINKSADDFGFGFPFVNLMDVFRRPTIDGTTSLDLINSTDLDRTEYSLFKGDVLFIRSSVKPSGVGLTTVIQDDLKNTVFSGFLIRFRCGGALIADFMRHCFAESSFRQRVIAGSTVSANTNINQDNLKRIALAWPSTIEEQIVISTALSNVDMLIFELEKLIAKKQAIKAATMQQLLTGRTRLPQFALREDGSPKGFKNSELGDIPQDWEVKPLSEVCSLKSGQSITADSISDEGGYPCYGGNGLRGFADKPTHSGRYVLVGRQGALCGNVNYIEGDFFASEHALVATGKNSVDMKWLALVLERMNLNQYSESSAQPGLSAIKLKVLPVLVPPLGEQQAIALLIRKLVFELSSLSNRLAKTRQLKQGMMQQLLTGKIRLVKPSTVSAS